MITVFLQSGPVMFLMAGVCEPRRRTRVPAAVSSAGPVPASASQAAGYVPCEDPVYRSKEEPTSRVFP